MRKKIVIFILVLLVIPSILVTSLMFHKTNKIKQNISDLVAKNSERFAVENIENAGFFSRRVVLKNFQIKGGELSDINFDAIELIPEAFADRIYLKLDGNIVVKSAQKETGLVIQPSSDSIIQVNFSGSENLQVKYSGSGYSVSKVGDNFKLFSVIFKDGESEFDLESKGQIVHSFSYQHKNKGLTLVDQNNNPVTALSSSEVRFSTQKEGDKTLIKWGISLLDIEDYNSVSFIKSLLDGSKIDVVASADVQKKQKYNLNSSGEFEITASENKMAEIMSPEQEEKLSDQQKVELAKVSQINSYGLKLKNLEISNAAYKMGLSGEVANALDDPIPFGVLNLRIENFDAVVAEIIGNSKKFSNGLESVQIMNSSGLDPIISALKDLGNKNPQSGFNNPIFEFKRQKNDGMNLTINGLKIEEVTQNFNKLITNNQNPAAVNIAPPMVSIAH